MLHQIPRYDERSGLHVAEQAHATGEASVPDPKPLQDVSISFVFHGSEQAALELANRATDLIFEDDGVQLGAGISIMEHK